MDCFVEVPSGRLYVRSDGDGPAIVLSHAAVVDHHSWDAVVPVLTAAGHRVVRYDHRPFGRSQTEDVEYSLEADVFAIMDALGIERAALAGNSMGARAVLQAALARPDRVVGAILVGCGLDAFEGEMTAAERAVWEEAERFEKAPALDVEAYVDLLVRFWIDGPGQPPTRVPAEVREAARAALLPVYQPDHRRGRALRLDPPIEQRFGEIRCSVLAVSGDLDDSTVLRTTHALGERIPGAHAVILPGVAHLIPMEAPAQLARLMLDFLLPLAPW